jgi:hypothetical protein
MQGACLCLCPCSKHFGGLALAVRVACIPGCIAWTYNMSDLSLSRRLQACFPDAIMLLRAFQMM